MASSEFAHSMPGEHVYDGMVFSHMHPRHILEKVPDFDLEGDLLLASYPKTGSTWMQELIWLLCNDGDVETSKTVSLNDRFPFLEFSQSEQGPYEYDKLLKQPHPRLVKTHLTPKFFQKQLRGGDVKVVVTVRNPKDTLVSLFHFYRMNVLLGNFTGTWDDFFRMYKAKHIYCGDFFDWYMSWWQLREKCPKILFVKYEDMKENLRKVALQVAKFIGKTVTEEALERTLRQLTFANMKYNTMSNFQGSVILKQSISPFMRKGIVGDWKNYFSEEQSEYVDKRYEETLKPAGLMLDFE